MKTKNLIVSLFFGLGLLSQALVAQNGPANARPEDAPFADPSECPYFGENECPGCQLGSPEDCPYAVDGTCPNASSRPNGERFGNQGPRANPEAEPRLDGSGGWGQPTDPAGPQDGSAPGAGYRGGRS